MSDDAEQQAEEIEVLNSIYYGYENFKQVNDTTFSYKFVEGEKSFILEVIWGPKYPSEKPKLNLDIFYNQSLLPSVREKILNRADEIAEQCLGSAMTFTIFERLKDKVEEILEEQTEEAAAAKVEKIVISEPVQPETSKKPEKKEKKEQLSKSQKRRAWDRAEAGRGGERPRGWNWIDIFKHLSQTPHQPPPN